MSRENEETLAAGVVQAQVGARIAIAAARALGRRDLVAMLERGELLVRAAERAIEHPLPVETVAP